MPSGSIRSTSKRRSGGSPVRLRTKRAARDALELRTLQAFRTIFASARAHDAEVRRMADISGSQLWALSEIARVSGMSVKDLSKRMAMHQTTMSNLINFLVDNKLVRRERDSADQRVVRLHATTEGKRMLLRAPGPYTGLLVDALRHLETSDLELLNKSLSELLRLLRGKTAEAAGQTLLGE